jgi:4-hydroxybenzoate polyprenyltransferase
MANPFAQLASISRIQDWWYILGITLLAYIHIYQQRLGLSLVWVPALAFSVVYLCWGYMFNNLFDREEDNVAKNTFTKMGFSSAFRITGIIMLGMIFLSSITRFIGKLSW